MFQRSLYNVCSMLRIWSVWKIWIELLEIGHIEQIINQSFFLTNTQDEEGRRSVQEHQRMEVAYDEEGEDDESDADDFIVDDDGRPITEKKKKVLITTNFLCYFLNGGA